MKNALSFLTFFALFSLSLDASEQSIYRAKASSFFPLRGEITQAKANKKKYEKLLRKNKSQRRKSFEESCAQSLQGWLTSSKKRAESTSTGGSSSELNSSVSAKRQKITESSFVSGIDSSASSSLYTKEEERQIKEVSALFIASVKKGAPKDLRQLPLPVVFQKVHTAVSEAQRVQGADKIIKKFFEE